MVVAALAVAGCFAGAAASRQPEWRHGWRGLAVVGALMAGYGTFAEGASQASWPWLAGWPVEWLCDAAVAGCLVILALWRLVSPWLAVDITPRALDVVAAGAALTALATSLPAALLGITLAVAGAYASRRLTCADAPSLRFAAILAVAPAAVALQPIVGAASAPWLAFVAAAVLLGAWPLHLAAASGGVDGPRVGLAVAGVGLILPSPAAVPSLLPAVAGGLLLVALAAALAAIDRRSSDDLGHAARGAALAALAFLDPTSAVVLLALCAAVDLALAGPRRQIDGALPQATTWHQVGGLATTLPAARRLAFAAAAVAAASPAALWVAARVATALPPVLAEPVRAILGGLVIGLLSLPVVRAGLTPFVGAARQTVADTPAGGGRGWLAAAGLALAAATPALALLSAALLPTTPSAAIGAGVALLPPLVGLLIWRRPADSGERPLSPLRALAAGAFGVERLLIALGRGIGAVTRFLWSAGDGLLAGGLPAAVGIGLRALGWLLARLHDGGLPWTAATAVGTGAILLWAWRGGGAP